MRTIEVSPAPMAAEESLRTTSVEAGLGATATHQASVIDAGPETADAWPRHRAALRSYIAQVHEAAPAIDQQVQYAALCQHLGIARPGESEMSLDPVVIATLQSSYTTYQKAHRTFASRHPALHTLIVTTTGNAQQAPQPWHEAYALLAQSLGLRHDQQTQQALHTRFLDNIARILTPTTWRRPSKLIVRTPAPTQQPETAQVDTAADTAQSPPVMPASPADATPLQSPQPTPMRRDKTVRPASASGDPTSRYYNDDELVDLDRLPLETALSYRQQGGSFDMRSGKLLQAHQEIDLAKRIEAGLYAQHKLTNGLAAAGDQAALRAIVRDGQLAKQVFVYANIGLAAMGARRFSTAPNPGSDIVQAAILGLVRAVEKFDYTKGMKFSTYAIHWLRPAIQEHERKMGYDFHVSQHAAEDLERVKREIAVHDQLGRMPTDEEIATATGMDPAMVQMLRQRLLGSALRLDAPTSAEGPSAIYDIVGSPSVQSLSPPDAIVDRLPVHVLAEAIDALPAMTAQIMRMAWNLDGLGLDHAQIAQKLGFKSRSTVGTYIKNGIEQLRKDPRIEDLRIYLQ